MHKSFYKFNKFVTTTILLVLFVVVFLFASNTFAQVDYGLDYATNVGLSTADLRDSTINIIRTSLGVLGIIALILIIYGGVIWMTAAGNAQKIETAKKILLNATIGLIIIMMAFGIVQFIFNYLGGDGGGGGANGCTVGEIRGTCELCTTPPAEGNFTWQYDWPGCDSILPDNSFILNDVNTAHNGATDKEDVFWCSKVQNVLNHNVDPDTVTAAVANSSIYVDSQVGVWSSRGNTITFTPENNEFTNRNTEYIEHLPFSLTDTDGIPLRNCSLSTGCAIGSDISWDFFVGNDGDEVNPKITATYPQSSDPANPDINVSRDPIVDVTFSEQVDADTVLDINGVNPYPGHITLYELDGKDGARVSTVDNSILTVDMKDNGFRMYLQSPNLLKSFTYYEIEIQDIADLCGNLMSPSPYSWQFATNDLTPGISSYYPSGDNVCTDSNITVSFNTSMYYSSVRMQITQGATIWNYLLPPGVVSTADANGEFRVADTGVPESNNYMVYEFIPINGLNENSDYDIYIETDKVVDSDGTVLTHQWNFSVTDLDQCVCSPYISRLSSTQGPVGQCLTVSGQCFTGTANKPATISYINFDTTNSTVPPVYSATAVGTTAPGGFVPNDRPQVTLAIDYNSGSSVPPSNAKEFLITPGQATGPCLWAVEPDSGARGLSGVRLIGDRFGDASSQSTRQVIFTPAANFDVVDDNNWTDTQITGVTVPFSTEDGDVVVTNDNGTSNGIYFDVAYCGNGVIEPGEACDGGNLNNQQCSNLGWIGGTLSCNSSCQFDTSSCSNAPQVVENGLCQMGCGGSSVDACFSDDDCDAGVQCQIVEAPSPNPYKNETDVCLNSAISVDFNTDMDQATFTTSNIFIEKCADADCTTGLTNVPSQITNTALRSFVLEPDNKLTPATFYKVTITTDIRSSAGVNMIDPYTWTFEAKNDSADCPLQNVYVEPQQASAGATQSLPYYAVPTGQFCTVLSGASDYDWVWSNDSTPNLGVSVTESLVDDSNATVSTANEKGAVYIKAVAENRSNRGRLDISFDTCDSDADCTNNGACSESTCDLVTNRCTPVVKSLSPDSGPPGRWVTIQGCNFKSSPGNVEFTQINNGSLGDVYQVTNYPCSNSWTDTEIIVATPDDLSTGSVEDTFYVNVQDIYGLRNDTSDIYTGISECLAGVTVPINGIPGICSINPNTGQPNDKINISGDNFTDDADTVAFNNIIATTNSWATTTISANVPVDPTAGDVVVSVNSCPSNGKYFEPSSGKIGDACNATSDAVCTADSSACWQGLYCETSSCTCQAPPNANILVDSQYPSDTNIQQCQNTVVTATFDSLMDSRTINSNTVTLYEYSDTQLDDSCISGDLPRPVASSSNLDSSNFFLKLFNKIKSIFGAKVDAQAVNWWCPVRGTLDTFDVTQGVSSCNQAQGCTTFTFNPLSPLTKNNPYELYITGGEAGAKTIYGGQLNTNSLGRHGLPDSYYWPFTAGFQICNIDQVDINVTFNTALNGPATRENTPYDYFTCAADDCTDDTNTTLFGNQHDYHAQAKDENGSLLSAAYKWEEYDNDNLIEINPPLDTQDIQINPNSFNGESTALVTAFDSNYADDISYGTSTAAVIITNNMCQNPWPSLEQFPFQDEGGNCTTGSTSCPDMTFSTYYCRDYGQMEDYCVGGDRDSLSCTDSVDCLGGGVCTSSTADDLPALKDPVIKPLAEGFCVGGLDNGNACTADSECSGIGYCYNVIKDYLFTYENGSCSQSGALCSNDTECNADEVCNIPSDSIGFRIYNNGEHLSPGAWFVKYANGGAAPVSEKVNSYESITSGRTDYINFAVDTGTSIFTNMFLLSFTDNYEPVTQNISNQFLDNLKFNTNGIYNTRTCSSTGTYCEFDSDCSVSGDTCNQDKDKLARDVIRLGAVSEMAYSLDLYRGSCSANSNLSCLVDSDCPNSTDIDNPEFCIIKNSTYPLLSAGTYKQGETVSVWDSWNTTFASLLGANLLIDPINKVYCDDNAGYNEECWNDETNTFQCNPGSFMYHYKSISDGASYNIYTNMEYSNNRWVPAPNKGSYSSFPDTVCEPGTYNFMFTKSAGGGGG